MASKLKVTLQKLLAYVLLWAQKPLGIFILGMVVGVLFFVCFYGVEIIDPANIGWLYNGGDLTQHFLGWEFFRREPWHFPFGQIDQLAYPFAMSVTYMDSIPIFALLFKAAGPLIPHTFQYFGLWGVLSFALQGGLGALLFRRWTKNVWVVLLATCMVVVSPVLLARMFIHTALASQWVLLLALCLLVYVGRNRNVRFQIAVWSGLFALTVLIHPYFLPMIGVVMAIWLIRVHDLWRWTLLRACIPPVVGAVIFWLIGGFEVGGSVGGIDTLGEYAFNLNGFWNSLGWSAYFQSIPNVTGSGEGLGYLGVSTLVLVPIAAVLAVGDAKIRAYVTTHKIRSGLYVVVFLGCIAFAASPLVQFNNSIVAHIPLPHKVAAAWSIFRATGRIIWPVYYMLIVFSASYVVYRMRRTAASYVVVLFLVVGVMQGMDILYSSQTAVRYKEVHRHTKEPKLSRQWANLTKDKSHLVYLDAMQPSDFYVLANVALRYNLTTNTGYFARGPYQAIEALQQKERRALLSGEVTASTPNLYVTNDAQFANALQYAEGYEMYRIDGYFVLDGKKGEEG